MPPCLPIIRWSPDTLARCFDCDVSLVEAWLDGEMENPGDLLRDPLDDWFAKFFSDRNRDEMERMKQMLEAAFPRKKAG